VVETDNYGEPAIGGSSDEITEEHGSANVLGGAIVKVS